MFYKTFVKTLINPRLRYLFKSNLSVNFNIHKSVVPFSTTRLALKDEKVKVTFVMFNGKRMEAEAKVGDTLLDVVVNEALDIEGFGACEGTITCSSCHLIFKQEDYDRLPKKPCDEERDMLDLAHGLTKTSRLGCQITLTKELDGLEVQVPETITDARS